MSDQLDVDRLFPQPRKEPQDAMSSGALHPQGLREPAPRPPQTPRPNNTLNVIAIMLAIFFGVAWLTNFRGCSPIPDDDTVVVEVEEPHVLMLWQDSDENVSSGQAAALTTTKIQTYCEEQGFEYRRYDVDDDLSNVEPVWSQLADIAEDPPSITIATPDSTETFMLPDGIEATLSLIKEETN